MRDDSSFLFFFSCLLSFFLSFFTITQDESVNETLKLLVRAGVSCFLSTSMIYIRFSTIEVCHPCRGVSCTVAFVQLSVHELFYDDIFLAIYAVADPALPRMNQSLIKRMLSSAFSPSSS